MLVDTNAMRKRIKYWGNFCFFIFISAAIVISNNKIVIVFIYTLDTHFYCGVFVFGSGVGIHF